MYSSGVCLEFYDDEGQQCGFTAVASYIQPFPRNENTDVVSMNE